MAPQKVIALVIASCLVCSFVAGETTPLPPEDVQEESIRFLKRFGYLKEGNEHNSENLVDAIKSMQSFAGLKETGYVDDATLAMMRSPRCSNQDMDASEGKAKRFATVAKWKKFVLDWKLFNFPSLVTSGMTNEDVNDIMATALNTWANTAKGLSFPVSNASTATLSINFFAGDHGDNNPFDGVDGVLGHAFYPSSGKIHFDDSETWTKNGGEGKDLAWVATHEFGHALGLGHSNVRTALMFPYYSTYKSVITLSKDDVNGILSLYPNI